MTDTLANRVLEFDPPFSNGMNASVVIGQPDFTSSGLATNQSSFFTPWGVALDSQGDVFVADETNNRVLEFIPPFSNGMNASVVIGQPDFISSSPATTQNGLDAPTGVALDQAGKLYVSDHGNNRVLEFDPPFSNGMNASVVIGQPNFTSSSPATTQSAVSAPYASALDQSGNLYVADQGNSRVLEFTKPFSNGMAASVVIGQPDFTTRKFLTTQSGLILPIALALDGGGNLYIVDSANNRVLEFKPPFSNGMNATVVFGQTNFTSMVRATTQSGLSSPEGVALDGAGNLYVVDLGNNRVLEFNPPFSNGMNASVVIGQLDFTDSNVATSQSGFTGPIGAAAKEP